jgi:hypothetical protein
MKFQNRYGLYIILIIMFILLISIYATIAPAIFYGWKIVAYCAVFLIGTILLVVGKDNS